MLAGMALHRVGLARARTSSADTPHEDTRMTKNMGTADRVIRLLVVLAIAAAYALGYLSGLWAIILGIVALAFLLTSLVGTCPGYLPFGISTRLRR